MSRLRRILAKYFMKNDRSLLAHCQPIKCLKNPTLVTSSETFSCTLFIVHLTGPRHSHACSFWKNGFLKSTGEQSDFIVVFGGTISDGTDITVVEIYDLKANAGWSKLTDASQPATGYGSSANSILTFNSRRMYIYGGTSSVNQTQYGDRGLWFYWRFQSEQISRYYVIDRVRVRTIDKHLI